VGKDGSPVTGKKFFISSPIEQGQGSGVSVESFFMSTQKLDHIEFVPKVGDNVEILYNRYGKVATMRKVTGDDEIIDF
jgi:hypothetical protein